MSTKPPSGTAIDWANPITSDLKVCLPLNEGTGNPADLVYSTNPTVVGSPTWVTTPYGPGLSCTLGSYLTLPNQGFPWNANTVPYTIRILHYPVWPASFAALIDTPTRSLAMFFSNTGNVDYGTFTTTAGGMTSSSWWDFVIAVNTINKADLYVNNASVATAVDAAPATATEALAIGGNTSGGGSNYVGTFALIQYWSRTLSPTEIASIYTDPWGIFVASSGNRINRVICSGGE